MTSHSDPSGCLRFEDEPMSVKVGEAGHHDLRNISWEMVNACNAALRKRGVPIMNWQETQRSLIRGQVRESEMKKRREAQP